MIRLSPLICSSTRRRCISTKRESKLVSANIEIGACFGPLKYRTCTPWNLYDGINNPIRKIYLNRDNTEINRAIVSRDSVKKNSIRIKLIPNEVLQSEKIFVTIEDQSYYGYYDQKDGILKPCKYDGQYFVKDFNINTKKKEQGIIGLMFYSILIEIDWAEIFKSVDQST